MPFDQQDFSLPYDLENSKADRIFYLADFIESEVSEDNLRTDIYHCGSDHCAYGWAETIPVFIRLGIPNHTKGTTEKGEFFGLSGDTKIDSYLNGFAAAFHKVFKSDIIRRLRESAMFVKEKEKATCAL